MKVKLFGLFNHLLSNMFRQYDESQNISLIFSTFKVSINETQYTFYVNYFIICDVNFLFLTYYINKYTV